MMDSLQTKLLSWFEHYGPGTDFGVRRILMSVLSEDHAMVEVAQRALDCVKCVDEGVVEIDEVALRSIPAPGRARLEQLLGIVVAEMDSILVAAADLRTLPEAARQMIEHALSNDPNVQLAADHLRQATLMPGEGLQTGRKHGSAPSGESLPILETHKKGGAQDSPQREQTQRPISQSSQPAGSAVPPLPPPPSQVPQENDPPHKPPEVSDPPPGPPQPDQGEKTVRDRLAGTVRPDGSPVKAVLEVIEGPHAGERFEFDRHETFIAGRSSRVNLKLVSDAYFSRHHFLLEFNPPRCYLRDLGSSNGTQVNDQRVRECFLHHGDIISGGKTRIRYTLELVSQRPSELSEQPRSDAEQTHTHSSKNQPVEVPGYQLVQKDFYQPGVGTTALARRLADGCLVVLRYVRPIPPVRTEKLQEFVQRASPLLQLNHPCLVRYLDIGVVDGRLYFASEHFETINVRRQFQNHPPEVLTRTFCALVCQVLGGLHYAHTQQQIHGAIQPNQLLTSVERGHLVTRLANFGLSRTLVRAGLAGITHEQETPGDVLFLAPELVTRSRVAESRTDLYAVGATLYFLLSGKPPYEPQRGKDPVAIILGDTPVNLGQRCPHLPPQLVAVVHRALVRDPVGRFASAQEMQQALLPFAR